MYPEDSAVQYKCEDGYTVEGADIKKLIICKRGKWTEGPTCGKFRMCRYAAIKAIFRNRFDKFSQQEENNF